MIRPILLRSVILAAFLCAASMAKAGTVLDFWHSYVPPQTGVKHYSFHVTNYKRGIFFGSCGLSTKSQQWAFSVDLAGDGPAYDSDRVDLSDDSAKSLKVVSGQISIDAAQTVATIELTVEQAGVTNKFVGNGKYKIKKLK
jgi:hypothetical protein